MAIRQDPAQQAAASAHLQSGRQRARFAIKDYAQTLANFVADCAVMRAVNLYSVVDTGPELPRIRVPMFTSGSA
jgi:hypothetical protein